MVIMIPEEIDVTHIEQAVKEIDFNGIPKQRESRKYLVQIDNALYPPKYVISVACKYLSGKELSPNNFIAAEAMSFLDKLGFEIVNKDNHKGIK